MSTRRGTTNRNARGSSEDRRRRRQWLLDSFGDGTEAPCSYCQIPVDFETITADRHPIPGCRGGRYVRGNIRPACGPCNSKHGATLRQDEEKPMVKYTFPELVDEVVIDEAPPRYGASASGYGSKIPTRYRVRYAGRMRRVYMMQYGNSGSSYVVVEGMAVFLDTDTEHQLSQEASA